MQREKYFRANQKLAVRKKCGVAIERDSPATEAAFDWDGPNARCAEYRARHAVHLRAIVAQDKDDVGFVAAAAKDGETEPRINRATKAKERMGRAN